MIHVQQLSKRFGRHQAVDGISFDVSEGEIVGFLGPNGAGKTTTLRMLTGYLPPTSGNASINGFDVFKQSVKARRSIGYMPEDVPLYREMTVKEYLTFRAKLKGVKGRAVRSQVNQTISECGLSDRRRKPIATLSKGYRQRVGLADALVHRPELLILDEPTNGLDPNQIIAIRKLIQELAKKHTILLSTHILSEVEMICSKVVIIDQGKIKACDTPSNLVQGMRHAGRIQFEVKADPIQVRKKLSALTEIKKVLHGGKQAGWEQFEIIVDSGTETRERLSNLAAQERWPVKTLYRHEGRLEDVFVELTRRD